MKVPSAAVVFVVGLGFSVLGCKSQREAASDGAEPDRGAPQRNTDAAEREPSATDRSESEAATSERRSVSPTSPLTFTPQDGWVAEPPASSTRKAQYRLPRADSDKEDASLVVYYFGGQGGSSQANIDRWAGQFEQPDGRSSADVLSHSMRKIAGMDIHEVELSGTYIAETSPGSGERVHKESWRMLAAIMQASEGPYYVKLVGPSATVTRWESSFRRFVGRAAIGN